MTMAPRIVATTLLLAGALALPQGAFQGAAAAPWDGCHRAFFRIVIDVGHTKEVPGALSARGVGEYEFNLALSRTIEKALIEKGFPQTKLLITPGRTQQGLVARVSHANQASAQLMLSIHHDSVPREFLSKWEYDGKTRPYSDRFSGHSLFVSTENPQFQRSLEFAKLLGKGLKSRGLQYAKHYTEKFMGKKRRKLLDAEVGVYQYNELAVLMLTTLPSVLLEAGSIINRQEEVAMASPERQKLIADAAVEAVEAFCQLPQVHARPDPLTTAR